MSYQSRRQLVTVILACLCSVVAAGPAFSVTVTDLKGRSLDIKVISVKGNSVTFTRQGETKEFTLPVDQFDPASQERIRKEATENTATAPPKLQPDIVIGKRRRDQNGSYYMVTQEITCTVKLANLSITDSAKNLQGTVVFIGKNTRRPDIYNVLSTQKFEAAVEPSASFAKEMEPFTTSYDSDNKGTGNVGGYQYFGYVFALLDGDGKVILNETATGSFRMALGNKATLLEKVLKYKKGTTLTDKLELLPNAVE